MANEPDNLFDGQVKTCSRCAAAKPVDEFHRNKNMLDGRASACKACLKASIETGATMQFICARCRSNCEKKNKGSQRYCEGCAAEIRRERDRSRRPRTVIGLPATCERCDGLFTRQHGKQIVCPPCVKYANAERGRNWALANPEKTRKAAKRSNDKRRATPKGHLEWTMRAAVKRAVIQETKAGRRTFDLLGYSVDDLKCHLEKQFYPGMSWCNYGEWHIDHRVPLASFQYETPDCPDFKAAWAITNLQPLWRLDNLSKGPKRLLLV